MIYILLVAAPFAVVAFFYMLGSYESESPRGSELSWSDRETKTPRAKTSVVDPQPGTQRIGSGAKRGTTTGSSPHGQALGSATVSSIQPPEYGRAA